MAGVTSDRCPGVLRPHLAADGAMVRIRVPGGQTTGTQLAALGRVAERYGSGLLQLTSRASLQIRGLPEVLPEAFENSVARAGFLPSVSHERIRNVVCSPLTGLAGGLADLRGLVHELDQAIRVEPALAALSGRFLLGLDDGRGDIAVLKPDLTYLAHGPDHGLLVVGADRAVPVPRSEAVATLIRLARSFVDLAGRSGAWRVRDLPSWVESVPGLATVRWPEPSALPLGRVGGHASVSVPLGLLGPEQVSVVAEVAGDGAVVLTPSRSLVVAGAAAGLDLLLAAGLVADPTSPWTAISACVGSPWCAKGRVDTQSLVRSVAGLDARWPRTHVSGCERRCGAPTGVHLDLVAPSRDQLLAAARAELVAIPELAAHAEPAAHA